MNRYLPQSDLNCSSCTDCGALVVDKATHDAFHGALDNQATMIALLQTAHISASLHDRWDVGEKFRKRRPNAHSVSHSAAAFAEVVRGDAPSGTEAAEPTRYVCPNCGGSDGKHSGMDQCPPDPVAAEPTKPRRMQANPTRVQSGHRCYVEHDEGVNCDLFKCIPVLDPEA